MKKKLTREKIGGSPQFVISAPELMKAVVNLDPALWAATSAPCESLTTNPKFISHLDPNNSGSIRVDEVIGAINFLLETFKSEQELNNQGESINIAELNVESDVGKDFLKFVKKSFAVKDEISELTLQQVSDKIELVSSGPLKGDGNLTAKAVENPDDLNLFNNILTVNGKECLTLELLDKFIADAEDFLDWEENTAKPELKVKDATLAYSAYSALKGKMDEFFSYCQLVAVDPVNANRFRLDPEEIPPLELKNPQDISDYLDSMPLSVPHEKLELKLSNGINSRYEAHVKDFSAAFKLTTLNMEKWEKIKQELAPYEEYCDRIYGDQTGKLGREKLEGYLKGSEIKNLRSILNKDDKLSDTLGLLKKLEKMILVRHYMPEFIDNFVNFKDLYTQGKTSIIQAGSLVIDGRHFDLILFVKNPAEHKKYALKSNLCMIYIELINKDKNILKQFAVASITTGSVNNLYIGKKGVFIDNEGVYQDATIIDFVNGPISFWQTMFLPFRKASEAISGRMMKLSKFNTIEQNINKGVKTAETQKKGFSLLNAGSIAVLCGSVGVAALGSGIAFAINKLKDVSWVKITSVFVGIIILIMAPAVISALLKLRRRNLALFLEAAGWAVNQHLKLKGAISRTFTYRPEYGKPKNNVWIYYYLLIVVLLTLGALILNQQFKWF
jgi:hypothetical protein